MDLGVGETSFDDDTNEPLTLDLTATQASTVELYIVQLIILLTDFPYCFLLLFYISD